MTDLVVVSGYGDDIVYVEGDLEEELRPDYPAEEEGVYVALSCGVLLKARYDGDWTVRLASEPPKSADVEIHNAHYHDLEGVREYSDAAVVEAESIEWAVLAEQGVVRGGDD